MLKIFVLAISVVSCCTQIALTTSQPTAQKLHKSEPIPLINKEPDVAKINSSRIQKISFQSIEDRIKAIEEHLNIITKEMNSLQEYLADIKEKVALELEKPTFLTTSMDTKVSSTFTTTQAAIVPPLISPVAIAQHIPENAQSMSNQNCQPKTLPIDR